MYTSPWIMQFGKMILEMNRCCEDRTFQRLFIMIRTSSDSTVELLTKSSTTQGFRKIIGDTEASHTELSGSTILLIASAGLMYTLHYKNIISVLEAKLSQTAKKRFIYDPDSRLVISQPLRGRVVKKSCVIAKQYIQLYGSSDVLWKEPNMECKRFFEVSCRYTVKSMGRSDM